MEHVWAKNSKADSTFMLISEEWAKDFSLSIARMFLIFDIISGCYGNHHRTPI